MEVDENFTTRLFSFHLLRALDGEAPFPSSTIDTIDSSTDPPMKLTSFLKAWSAIVPGHKTRSRLSKRLPGPKVSSKFTRESQPHPSNDQKNHGHNQQQQKLCEHCKRELVSAAPRSPSAVPPHPARLAAITSPQRDEHLPPRPSPPNRPLPPLPLLCHSQPRAVPDDSFQEDYEGTNASTSSYSSGSAVVSRADGDPADVTEELGQIVANLPSLPMQEDEISEPRPSVLVKEQLDTAIDIGAGAIVNPDPAGVEGLQPGSSIAIANSPMPTLSASSDKTRTIRKGHDCLHAGCENPCVAPVTAPLTDGNMDALGDHRTEADDEHDYTVSQATLPHDGVHDSVPPSPVLDEEHSSSRGMAIGFGQIPWDHILASIPHPNFNKRKRSSSSKHRLLHPYTHLPGIPEEPLRLSTCGEIAKDGTLAFKFSASDKAQSTVDEALDDFENFLNQHANLLELDLTLAAGACLPADFLARAIAKAQTRLARFIHVTIRLEGAAAQAQATWIWPPKSQLRVLRLVGIARGGVLPLTQLQGLFLCEEVKPVEIASFLTSLPQLRVLALCLGCAGSKRSFHGPSVLPQLERLDLYVRVDPAAFFACVHLPALRSLNLHVSGHRIRWEDDQLVEQGAK
ncbi:uncharacterized protein SCHCODRAFT_01170149 [Schizophyllum commune H4-8]|nr:uncharacterized protein SCHCODRAFT_01170149 [Schizophyllum commune H4-8]KAI5895839.1 hypothetical protein SCHCODRAFT_01170149 [Schizophyllum commune H4-8]